MNQTDLFKIDSLVIFYDRVEAVGPFPLLSVQWFLGFCDESVLFGFYLRHSFS